MSTLTDALARIAELQRLIAEQQATGPTGNDMPEELPPPPEDPPEDPEPDPTDPEDPDPDDPEEALPLAA